MTDREKAIVMAYTGVTMLSGEKFSIFHEYVEEIMKRPVFTHELGSELVWEQIKEASKPDFIRLCREKEDAYFDIKEILDIIHKTIYQFFDVHSDDEEVPMSDKDKLLLEVNKAICNNLKEMYNARKQV